MDKIFSSDGQCFAKTSCRRWPTLPLFPAGNQIPKRLATQIAIVNLVHSRQVRRRNLLAKGCPLDDFLLLPESRNFGNTLFFLIPSDKL
ncbi:MAG: hypothetical protein LBK82_12125 [Planctomycetaceae bacterium]|nr:hypothetical protein [Planctomycetaceae bacterium]